MAEIGLADQEDHPDHGEQGQRHPDGARRLGVHLDEKVVAAPPQRRLGRIFRVAGVGHACRMCDGLQTKSRQDVDLYAGDRCSAPIEPIGR